MHASKEKWIAAFETVKSQFKVTDLLTDYSPYGKSVFKSTYWLWEALNISMLSDHCEHHK